jgi:PAS domain S-box-containing protein
MDEGPNRIGTEHGSAELAHAHSNGSRLTWLTWLPVPLSLAAILIIWAGDWTKAYGSQDLLLLLNTTFLGAVPFFVAILIGRSFLDEGNVGLLLTGSGVVISTAANVLCTAVPNADANFTVTIHNSGAATAALCQFIGALLLRRPAIRLVRRGTSLAIVYLACFAFVVLITMATAREWMPIFFVQGLGGTLLRQIVLSLAIALLGGTALLMGYTSQRSASHFLRWYAAALALTACGLFGVMVQSSFGSLLGWTGRASQYLGGLYMLIAAVAAAREARRWALPLEAAFHAVRQRYEHLFELAGVGIALHELACEGAPGYFIDANPALCKMLGYSRDEMSRLRPLDIMAPEEHQAIPNDEGAMAREGTFRYEKTLMAKGGHCIPVEIVSRTFKQQGQTMALLIIQDVTERKAAEDVLRQSQEMFRRLFHSSASAMALARLEDGCLLDVNSRWEELAGWRRDDVIGKTTTELGAWKIPAEREEIVLEVQRKGMIRDRECTLLRPDGREWVVLMSAEVVNLRGQQALVTSGVDITERKRVEEALRASEERLRTMIENSRDGINMLDLRTGRYVLMSPAQVALTGFTAEELSNITAVEAHERIHPDDRELSIRQQKLVAEGRESEITTECRWKVKSGEYRWFSDSRKAVLDPHGQPIALVGISRDITADKQAQEEMRQSQQRFMVLTQNLESGVALVDEDGKFSIVNPAFLRLFDLKESNDIRNVNDLDWAEWRVFEENGTLLDVAEHPVRKAALTGHPVRNKLVGVKTPSGTHLKWMLISAEPVFKPDGRLQAIICTYHDVTARKQAEEDLRRMNESLEQRVAERTAEVRQQADQLRALATELTQAEQRERRRLAQILHDHIQQLLVGARMQLSLVKRGDLELMHSAAQGVDAILDEALAASRSLTVELFPPVLHQSGLVAALYWLGARLEEKQQFKVHIRAATDAEPVNPDARTFLFDAVRELLLNADKHSGVREAHLTMMRTKDGHCRVIVEDAGKGFDAASISSSKSGFGLFSIQQRLLYLGGTIEVEGAPGRGTKAVMTIPIGQSGIAPEVEAAAVQTGTAGQFVLKPKGQRIGILLVDDHKIMRQGLSSLLQFEGDLEVIAEAENGQEALILARKYSPDVVVMDVNLPVISGIEATRMLRQEMPGIKVIGLSMHLDGNAASAMREAGAVAFLTKGGPSEDLVEAIRACCR